MSQGLRKPKAVLVPFGYPGYPQELLERFTEESEKVVKNLQIDLTTTPIVKVLSDIPSAQKLLRERDYDFIIALILSWIEAPQVIETLKEYFSKPILLWSHTMFKEKGERLTLGPIPGVGVIRETLEEMEANFKFIWGMPKEKKVQDQISSFAKVASTIHQLSHSRIGLLGYISMGMYTAAFDHLSLRKRIGPEIDQLDQYVLIKKIEEIKPERVKRLINQVKKEWNIAKAVTPQDLDITLKMYLALKDLVKEFNWSAVNIKCQYELSKYYKHTPCVPLSMLGDELPCSCEGDIPLITTQLIMYYLSGATATYCDIHTIEENRLLMGACGYAPFSLGKGKAKVDRTTVLYEGLANCTIYREGEVTLARLAYTKDREYKMHIAKGQAHQAEPFHEVGCLPYPSMEVTLEGSGEEFGQQLMSQHYSVVYADIQKELLELCRLFKIKPILVQ